MIVQINLTKMIRKSLLAPVDQIRLRISSYSVNNYHQWILSTWSSNPNHQWIKTSKLRINRIILCKWYTSVRDYRRMLSVTETGWLPTLCTAGINLLFSVTDDISCSLFVQKFRGKSGLPALNNYILISLAEAGV